MHVDVYVHAACRCACSCSHGHVHVDHAHVQVRQANGTEHFNPVMFYKAHKDILPVFYRCACKVYADVEQTAGAIKLFCMNLLAGAFEFCACTHAHSTGMERVGSSLSMMLRPHRQGMSPEVAQNFIMAKCNHSKLFKVIEPDLKAKYDDSKRAPEESEPKKKAGMCTYMHALACTCITHVHA